MTVPIQAPAPLQRSLQKSQKVSLPRPRNWRSSISLGFPGSSHLIGSGGASSCFSWRFFWAREGRPGPFLSGTSDSYIMGYIGNETPLSGRYSASREKTSTKPRAHARAGRLAEQGCESGVLGGGPGVKRNSPCDPQISRVVSQPRKGRHRGRV